MKLPTKGDRVTAQGRSDSYTVLHQLNGVDIHFLRAGLSQRRGLLPIFSNETVNSESLFRQDDGFHKIDY